MLCAGEERLETLHQTVENIRRSDAAENIEDHLVSPSPSSCSTSSQPSTSTSNEVQSNTEKGARSGSSPSIIRPPENSLQNNGML